MRERWDGSGYPYNLKGDRIPLISRIVAIADAYDAMTHERTYSPMKSKEEALLELQRCSGSQFDPNIVRLFMGNVDSIFSAQSTPSTAAEMIPPEYPAPSPQG